MPLASHLVIRTALVSAIGNRSDPEFWLVFMVVKYENDGDAGFSWGGNNLRCGRFFGLGVSGTMQLWPTLDTFSAEKGEFEVLTGCNEHVWN